MRLNIVKSKNAISYYVIESTYIHGKRSTRTVEKIGTYKELVKDHEDPETYARQYVDKLNKQQLEERKELQENSEVIIKLNTGLKIQKNNRQLFNGGYLFLQDIFYDLGLNQICDRCSSTKNIQYNLTEILSRLVYSRILYPGSKAKTYEFSKRIIEPSSFEQHDIYRALSLLCENSEFIQSELYNNSKKLGPRSDEILYYDCTNYYFEIEQEDDFRKYGKAKSHKPNPIVGMGLFMDADGIPLAFSMFPGNTNEQLTLTPLEERIEKDFNHSKFVVCTDAGLSSKTNRLFNSKEDKSFITTQSIKKLPEDLQEWALGNDGWKLMFSSKSDRIFSIDELESDINLDSNNRSIYYDKVFYKERRYVDEFEIINADGEKVKEYIDEKFIVTYSLKYRDYLRYIRNGQIERAEKLIDSCTDKNGKVSQSKAQKRYGQTDFHRFIYSAKVDINGEVATDLVYTIRQDLIDQEEKYDGFYCVATDLDDKPEDIIAVNKKRWEIEECFRIIKQEFNAEPIYLSREDRIKVHFLVCFIALVVYRYLEKKLSSSERTYTILEIISELKEMNFLASSGNGYIPTYTRTDLTDRLHQVFGFRTDYQIIPLKNMRKIIKKTKE